MIKENRYRAACAVVNAHEEQVVEDYLSGMCPLIYRRPDEEELRIAEARILMRSHEAAERGRRRSNG